jgi:hypothetical protein
MTATQLANITIEENTPINWGGLRYIDKKYTRKEKLEWAKGNVECFADSNCSKHKITRAAKILLQYLNM